MDKLELHSHDTLVLAKVFVSQRRMSSKLFNHSLTVDLLAELLT